MKEQLHTVVYGWSASPLGDPSFLKYASIWALFASKWIIEQAKSMDAKHRFQYLPAGLFKGVCDIWGLLARTNTSSRDEIFTLDYLTQVALFCVEFMNRSDLIQNIVLLDRFLSLMNTLAHMNTSTGNNKRTLQGRIMEIQIIRELLPPAIMHLYSTCHAVMNLNVNEDITFDKTNIRRIANELLVMLYHYPLPEPKEAIVKYMQQHADIDSFLFSAMDCLLFTMDSLIQVLKQIKEFEQYRPQSLIPPLLINQARSTQYTTSSTLIMLTTFAEGEELFRLRLTTVSEVRSRVTAMLYTLFAYVSNDEAVASLRIQIAEDIGYNEKALIGKLCMFLVSILSNQPTENQELFVATMQTHPDYSGETFEYLSNHAAGSVLKPFLPLLLRNFHSSSRVKSAVSSINSQSNGTDGIPWNEWVGDESEANQSFESVCANEPTVSVPTITLTLF